MLCDYLIIGGGSAGCVVARRLAEKTSGPIILVEAGKSDEGDAAANDLFRLDEQTADYDWGFKASAMAGQPAELKYARARLLGGCANHNDCAFIRPPDSDFDGWEKLGASGWNAAAMAPWFERVMETISVEPAPCHPLSRAFIDAGKQMGLGEVNFQREVREGTGLFPLNAKGRLRQSSSNAYLHPLAGLPKNLEIWTETFADRLIISNNRVTGAETSRGLIHAARGVILTAGAIQTPQLMMVSGLGPAAHLKSHGIGVIADLPHVGQHLRDHVAAAVVWETREPVAPWQVCPFEATMMLKLEEDAPAPDILFHFGLRVREKYDSGPRFGTMGPAVKASPNVTRAKSEGSITLSGPSMHDKPVIDLNYLSDPYDRRLGASRPDHRQHQLRRHDGGREGSYWDRCGLATRHRREEGHFAGARDGRVELRMGLIDGGLDGPAVSEDRRQAVIAQAQEIHQFTDGCDRRRHLDLITAASDNLAQAREIKNLHVNPSTRKYHQISKRLTA